MGCFQSKKEITDQHPNVFRVINIDENGSDLCSGQLEVSESEIVLYREGRNPVVWPLHCLRRFGFDGELFSFEAGRRCETGEGIYGFKCRRASLLFTVLHQRIYQRNIDRDTIPTLSSPILGRQTLQASVIHRSSVDNGQPINVASHLNNNSDAAHMAPAPHSPSSTDILEVMPLYPRPQSSGSHVTNIYQLKDFKREHNNNQSEAGASGSHPYTNDLSKDLAELRKALKQETAFNSIKDMEEEQNFIATLNEGAASKIVLPNPISPTLSTVSERYAQLNMEHGDPRLYVNVACSIVSSPIDGKHNDTAPPTPLTPKQVEYCNLTIAKSDTNSYANMMMSDLSDKIRSSRHASEHNQKFSESDTFTSMSPVEEMEVNYAVLDIDSNNEAGKPAKELGSPDNHSIGSNDNSIGSSSTQTRNVGVSSSSYDIDLTNTSQAAAIGYTSIDFAATSALSSVVTKTDIFLSEAGRKHRHNSCTISCGSPGSSDKSRGNN